MMLNGTFIIQAGNFLCAYLILDTVLFRPVFALIAQEDAIVSGKNAAIVAQEAQRVEQEKKIQQFWAELHKEFGHKRPFFVYKPETYSVVKRPRSPEITKTELQHAVNQAVAVLVDRCARVKR